MGSGVNEIEGFVQGQGITSSPSGNCTYKGICFCRGLYVLLGEFRLSLNTTFSTYVNFSFN